MADRCPVVAVALPPVGDSVSRPLGFLAGLLMLVCLISNASAGLAFDPGRSSVNLRVGDFEIPYRVFGWFAMPGDTLRLSADQAITVEGFGGLRLGPGREVVLLMPESPGHHDIRIDAGDEQIQLNLFVMRPASAKVEGRLGDFRVGEYPQEALKGLAVYAPPQGFVEVHRKYRDIQVSPHFKLGQFLSKQRSGWPKYLALRPELLIKLESTLERINAHGIRASTLTVMSGYRTPWYNRAIGNRTTWSRHLYGGAADVFIDENPRDGRMDDVNGDGKVNKEDANHLFDLLEEWSTTPVFSQLAGGLGSYGSNAVRGPFIHIDARGYRARWGR